MPFFRPSIADADFFDSIIYLSVAVSISSAGCLE